MKSLAQGAGVRGGGMKKTKIAKSLFWFVLKLLWLGVIAGILGGIMYGISSGAAEFGTLTFNDRITICDYPVHHLDDFYVDLMFSEEVSYKGTPRIKFDSGHIGYYTGKKGYRHTDGKRRFYVDKWIDWMDELRPRKTGQQMKFTDGWWPFLQFIVESPR
jgi:hypothetical protein